MLHVLTDKKGRIIGAGFLDAGRTGEREVRLQITPLKGQEVHEVPMPQEFRELKDDDDFRRLITEFRLSRGKKKVLEPIRKNRRKQPRAKR
jgi:hypothetical protein